MKLPSRRIEAIMGNVESRYVTTGVLFDADKGLLVATDGHCMAVIPAKPEKGDQTGMISCRAWQLARAAAKRIPHKLRDKVVVSFKILKHRLRFQGFDETTVLPKLTGTFPKWNEVIAGVKPKITLSLNAELLYKLAVSLCEPSSPVLVTLVIEASDKMVAVIPETGNGCGVIMPCRCKNTAYDKALLDLGIKQVEK